MCAFALMMRTSKTTLSWGQRRDALWEGPSRGDTEFIGESKAAQKVRELVELYADHAYPVLLIGETGSGKEVVARMLHERSHRSRGESQTTSKFYVVNAAQLDKTFAQSHLFGYLKGAFTGADKDKMGRIEQASHGTFFLDEILNLDSSVQARLLRALNKVDQGIIEVEPLGASKRTDIKEVPVRFIAAAQKDPRSEQDAGRTPMRTDLFYRLAGLTIQIPPLRERGDDIRLLAEHILKQLGFENARHGEERPERRECLSDTAVAEAIDALRLDDPRDRALPLPVDLEKELARIKLATMDRAFREARKWAGAEKLLKIRPGSFKEKKLSA
jgi:DNA-binding NtrC family response regulator